MADEHLDCKDLNCPMPIVKISSAIKALAPGQTLSVEANDPAFKADLEAWARKLGHKIISFESDDVQKATIEKV